MHPMQRHRTQFMAVLVAAAVMLACGKGGAGGPGGSGTTEPPGPLPTSDFIRASSAGFFDPATLNTSVGHPVTFSFASVGHNVYFAAVPNAPPNIEGTNANTTVTRTFTNPGTFNYSCHIHPTMTGVVIVQ